MTDDFLETLRRLDGAEYPGRGDRLDPALVVRAGRRRRTTRRIAGASTACVVVLALGLAAPSARHWYLDRQPTFPAGTPTTAAPTASPAPTTSAPPVTVPSIPSPLPGDGMAPPGAVLAPGVLAATGLPAEPFTTTGVGEKTADRWFHLGTTGDTTVVLQVATADDGQTFAAYGVRDGEASTLVPGGAEARFDADPYQGPWATTTLPGHDGTFVTGLAPAGVAHVFYVSSGGFDTGDGTRRFALEVPTFAVPRGASTHDPDQRMFALAFTQPATDRLDDMTSGMVYTRADGSIVDPSCGADTCTATSLPGLPDAYAEIEAILSGVLPTPCAEFPATDSTPGDVEGWWNSSPADADANVLWDPALWPAEPREHPRVALVDTATGSVISTWDRIACGPDPDFVPAPLSSGPSGPTAPVSWPAGSIAVVDMDTNEMIYVLDSPGNG